MGKARILTPKQQEFLFEQIDKHRHPEKNRLIMLLSFRLGLRVQEIALLKLKEVVDLEPPEISTFPFTVNEVLSLPKNITKGAGAINRSRSTYQPKKISFSIEAFNVVVQRIADKVAAGKEINPSEFYPEFRKKSGKSRDLPLVDQELRDAIKEYVDLRINHKGLKHLRKTDPLIISQKGGAYSPNTLQEHMALMLRKWAGIEKGSSHSGRRTVLNDIIHHQKRSLKLAQQIAGHVNGSTTMIYTEASEEDVASSLQNLAKKPPS